MEILFKILLCLPYIYIQNIIHSYQNVKQNVTLSTSQALPLLCSLMFFFKANTLFFISQYLFILQESILTSPSFENFILGYFKRIELCFPPYPFFFPLSHYVERPKRLDILFYAFLLLTPYFRYLMMFVKPRNEGT